MPGIDIVKTDEGLYRCLNEVKINSDWRKCAKYDRGGGGRW